MKYATHKIMAIFALLLAYSSEANNRIEAIYGKPADSLIVADFLYDTYWAQASEVNVEALAADEQYLAEANVRTNDFFERAFQAYYAQKPLHQLSEIQLMEHVELGMALLKQPSMALQIQGDRLLQEICNVLEDGMESEAFDHESEWMAAMVAMLKQESYHVKPPTPSDTEKATKAISSGNLGYLSDRLYSRCVLDCESGNCGTPCIGLYAGLFAASLLLLGLALRWKRQKS